MPSFLRTSVKTLALFFFVPALAYAEVQNDFDGDGRSDYTTIDIENGSLVWKAQLSSTGATQNLGSVGTNGDHVILGSWFTGIALNTGVATLNKQTKEIRWDVIDNSNTTTSRTFGKDGDLVMPGDFDGNGIFDAAVARLKNKKVVWNIVTDMFTKENGVAPITINFGVNGDRLFFARPEGGSADSLCVVRKGSGSRSKVMCRDLSGARTVEKKKFPAFASGNLRPRPFPVHQSTGADILGFELLQGNSATYRFTTFDGEELFTTKLSENNPTAVVGEYSDFPGEEVAVQGATVTYIINPVQKLVTSAPRTAGIPVDQININTLKTDSAPSNEGSSGGNDSGDSAPPGSGLSSVCSSVSPLSGMLVKAEISDHISKGDARATGFTLVCGKSCVQFVADFFYCDGSKAGSFGYYGRWEGNGQPRAYGAAGGAPQHFVSSIRSIARSKKCGTNLYLKRTNSNPSQCLSFDSMSSRVGSPF